MRFTPQYFRFLRDLEKHNDRQWFLENQDRFEQHVRTPCLQFIEEMGDALAMFGPYQAVAKKQGGSLTKIQTDRRFQRDKPPYKTWMSMRFRHATRPVGFYLRMGTEGSFAAAGSWQPDRDTLMRFREAIAEDHAGWLKATAGLDVVGDALKRVPQPWDADHPAADTLRQKEFLAVERFSQKAVTSEDFQEEFLAACAQFAPLNDLLAHALD